MKNNNVLVIGLGISGIAAIKAINKLGASVALYDNKTKEQLGNKIKEIQGINVKYHLGDDTFNIDDFDLAIKSPGIDLDINLIKRLKEKNISVISDVEAAYRFSNNNIIAITGTNGKTTTTSLVGELLNNNNLDNKLTGNIGSGIFLDALEAGKDTILVAETSSFQLESTEFFKPKVSIITNITPDHLDWHNGYDNYKNAKFKVAINQDKDDYCILNYDDQVIKENSKNIKANIIFFSTEEKIDKGICLHNSKMMYIDNEIEKEVIDVSDIFIKGKHNIQNAMAAVAAAIIMNVPFNIISETLKTFRGVEHRLEFVGKFNDMNFYNDSKGTNPEASIKAIEAIEKPMILIAGGYDKGAVFDSFICSFNDKVKHMIVLGETADKIIECAKKYGFDKITKVKIIDEAVKLAFEIGYPNDNVVLSPACASWDMYSSFEVRGRDFKERVFYYGGKESKKL